jgi:hypothetical protein
VSQQELLISVVRSLNRAGIKYMVTGSLVSSLQGEPRSTHDIDFVVSVDQDSAAKLVKDFPAPGFHLDEIAIRDAISNGGMFNLIEVSSGDKVDFWLLTEEDFDQERFSRRRYEEIMGHRIAVSSPEDTILMKLKWARLSGGSEKQYVDALRVYEVQSGNLDMQYLNRWAEKLALLDLFGRMKDEAEVI